MDLSGDCGTSDGADLRQLRENTMLANSGDLSTIAIKVIGVGGAGGNAVNSMVLAGLPGVEFIMIDTDRSSLKISRATVKLHCNIKPAKGPLGLDSTRAGREIVEQNQQRVQKALTEADMVFIIAGLGGAMGTGGAASIAETARGTGALTIGVVTRPYSFEGSWRAGQADAGLDQLRSHVDTLVIITADNLYQTAVKERSELKQAFQLLNDTMSHAVRCILDLTSVSCLAHLDFADIKPLLKPETGTALTGMLGIGKGNSENRAIQAARMALSSPLLERPVQDACTVLVDFRVTPTLSVQEMREATTFIAEAADPDATFLFNALVDSSMKDDVEVVCLCLYE